MGLPDVRSAIEAALAELDGLDDAHRARDAAALLDTLTSGATEAATRRAAAVRAMSASGMSLAQIGEALSISKSRAAQLATDTSSRKDMPPTLTAREVAQK